MFYYNREDGNTTHTVKIFPHHAFWTVRTSDVTFPLQLNKYLILFTRKLSPRSFFFFVVPAIVITYGWTLFGLEVAGESAYLIHIHNKRNIQRFQLYYAVLAERRVRIGVRASLGVIAEKRSCVWTRRPRHRRSRTIFFSVVCVFEVKHGGWVWTS